MNIEAISLQERTPSLQMNAVDGLAAEHFDRAFMMFSMFVDDPRVCLDLSDRVFRHLQADCDANEGTLYGEIVRTVREISDSSALTDTISVDSMLCWLLKDGSDFTYAEIGLLMDMNRAEVQERICETRMALIG